MQFTATVHPRMAVALVSVAARHSTSVEAVITQAVAEYLADYEPGLVLAPPPTLRSLAGRSARSHATGRDIRRDR